MPYSIIHKNEVKDFVFIQQNEFTYAVYLRASGKKRELLGQVFKIRRKWTVVGGNPKNKFNRTDGFATRLDAAFFLVRLMGYDS